MNYNAKIVNFNAEINMNEVREYRDNGTLDFVKIYQGTLSRKVFYENDGETISKKQGFRDDGETLKYEHFYSRKNGNTADSMELFIEAHSYYEEYKVDGITVYGTTIDSTELIRQVVFYQKGEKTIDCVERYQNNAKTPSSVVSYQKDGETLIEFYNYDGTLHFTQLYGENGGFISQEFAPIKAQSYKADEAISEQPDHLSGDITPHNETTD